MVGKWTGGAVGLYRESNRKRDQDSWVSSWSLWTKNHTEEKFRWSWAESMIFRKEKEAWMIRIAREDSCHLIYSRPVTLAVSKHNYLFLHAVFLGYLSCSPAWTSHSFIHPVSRSSRVRHYTRCCGYSSGTRQIKPEIKPTAAKRVNIKKQVQRQIFKLQSS